MTDLVKFNNDKIEIPFSGMINYRKTRDGAEAHGTSSLPWHDMRMSHTMNACLHVLGPIQYVCIISWYMYM